MDGGRVFSQSDLQKQARLANQQAVQVSIQPGFETGALSSRPPKASPARRKIREPERRVPSNAMEPSRRGCKDLIFSPMFNVSRKSSKKGSLGNDQTDIRGRLQRTLYYLDEGGIRPPISKRWSKMANREQSSWGAGK